MLSRNLEDYSVQKLGSWQKQPVYLHFRNEDC
jgi:hypothetical protein